MKIEQVGNSPVVSSKPQATSYRDLAIAKLKQSMGQAPSNETLPVSDPTNVSPEEMSGISKTSTDTAGREIISEEVDTTAPVEMAATEETKAPETAEEESLSSQYAILARKQKAIRAREQQIKAREAAIKAAEDARLAPPKPAFDESKYISKDRLTQDPLSTLADLGLTYDQLTNLMLNQANPQQLQQDAYLRKLEAKIADLEQKTERTAKTFEEGQIEARANAVKQIQYDVNKMVSTDPSYELIKLNNASAEVVKLIEATFDEDGTLLSIEEAAEQVENELFERNFRITSSSEKIKKRLQSVASTQTAAKQLVTSQVKQPLKTLTNNVGSSRPLTARERAIAKFNQPK